MNKSPDSHAPLSQDMRVWTVTSLLHSNFTRKRWERISARQWINRLLLLFQRPILFIVYKQETTGWRRVFHSHHDYAYRQHFKKQILTPLHSGKHNDFYHPDRKSTRPLEPELIPHTKFGIILIEVRQKTTAASNSPDSIKFAPIDRDAEEYVLLKALWDTFLNSPYSESVGVIERLTLNLDRSFGGKNAAARDEPNMEQPAPDDSQLIAGFLEREIKIIEADVIDPIYKEVESSPLISNQGKSPRNIFFLLRYYDEARYRDRFAYQPDRDDVKYPYSIRMLLPETQEKDIRRFLKRMKDLAAYRNEGKETWRYQYRSETDPNQFHTVDKAEYPDKPWANWFWRTLEKENGMDDFITILKSPFGKKTRALADPAIASGFVHFRTAIFADSGKNRLHHDGHDIKKKSQDMQRLVIMHYLFGAAAPMHSTPDNMAAMIVPLRAGGRTYLTISQITVMEQGGQAVGKDSEHWLRNIHFFSDIGRHAVQRLRAYSKASYLKRIREIFAATFIGKLESASESKPIAANAIANKINRQYENLCRIWPYPLIRVKFRPGKAHEKNETSLSMVTDEYHLRFQVEETNTCYHHRAYPPLSSYSDKQGFIEKEAVKHYLQEAIEEIKEYVVNG